MGRAKVSERSLDFGIGHTGEALAGGAGSRESGEALLSVAGMLLEVQRDHRLDTGSLFGVEVATSGEMLGERIALGPGPCLERRDQLGLIDQSVLQRQYAEKQVVGGCHGVCLPGSGSVPADARIFNFFSLAY